jgi:hypothetical protein
MSLAVRRIRRLLGTGSPTLVVRAARRSVDLRRASRALEAALASDKPLVVGPFLGEVGYELLYWRPYVLHLLRTHRVAPERVTIVSRGGAGTWYREVAGRIVDAFELVEPDEIRVRMDERRRATGERKQTREDALDRELFLRASPQRSGMGGAEPIHPLHMFWRSRFAWEGLADPATLLATGDYDELPRGELEPAVAALLPDRFVAVKAYYNDCLPDGPATRAGLAALIHELAADVPVVLLAAGAAVDDHADWTDARRTLIEVAPALRPETNLAQQAAIVARAEALVATYGGFSYVGPFLDVPTVAVSEQAEANPNHERILRAVRPDATYVRTDLEGGAAAVRDALA